MPDKDTPYLDIPCSNCGGTGTETESYGSGMAYIVDCLHCGNSGKEPNLSYAPWRKDDDDGSEN